MNQRQQNQIDQIGKDLKRLRAKKDFSTRQLEVYGAKRNGYSIDHSQISRLENNLINDPSFRLIAVVATGLGLTIDVD